MIQNKCKGHPINLIHITPPQSIRIPACTAAGPAEVCVVGSCHGRQLVLLLLLVGPVVVVVVVVGPVAVVLLTW
ncbi:unnamed protein product [Gadus morhua 'NCC']